MGMITATRRPSGSISTSSTADIAFLLLIFFLVTTVFPKDKGLSLILPREAGDVSQSNVMHLQINPSGLVDVRIGASPQVRSVSADEIGAIWQQAVSTNPRLIGAIKTHPDAAYGKMIDVLDELHRVRAQRISLQVLPEGRR